MTNKIFFANKICEGPHAGAFVHIHPHPKLVGMCCGKDEPIYEVKIREVRKGETSQYWGCYSNEKKEYSMIWPSKHQSNMCFPYGPKAAEEGGAGRQVNLVLEEMGVWKRKER